MKKNINALIGYTGFVGSTLLKQLNFDRLYRSSNINELKNQSFDMVICAGAPAQKWIANRDPTADRQNIDKLIDAIKTIKKCKAFVLISTVDVFNTPNGVNEDTRIDNLELSPYGLNRRLLEQFVENQFKNHLIVRLPGLIGPGLRKNVIFDLLNSNNIDLIDTRCIFQYYPMVNLWCDIKIALNKGLNLVHLTAEPVSTKIISKEGFGRDFHNEFSSAPANYDMQTKYADIYGVNGLYQYSSKESIQAVRTYAQSETHSMPNESVKVIL